MENKSTRLRFTEEELSEAPVRRAVERAEKAADKADRAKSRLPTKSKLRTDEDISRSRAEQLRFGKKDVSDPESDGKSIRSGKKMPKGKGVPAGQRSEKSQWTLDHTEESVSTEKTESAVSKGRNAEKGSSKSIGSVKGESRTSSAKTGVGKEAAVNGKPPSGKQTTNGKSVKSRLRFDDSAEEIVMPKHSAARTVTHTVAGAAAGGVHKEIRQNEDDNVGIQAAHQSEEAVEGTAHAVEHGMYSSKLRKYEKAAKLERKADKANMDALYAQKKAENPEALSNPISRWRQRQTLKKEYAAAKAASYGKSTGGAAAGTARTAETTRKRADEVIGAIKKAASSNSAVKLVLIGMAMLVVIVSLLQSCSAVTTGVLSGVSATAWPADDAEISRAEAYYVKLEAELQKKVFDYESDHSDSYEFNYNIGEIGHDPAVLISYLSAKYGDFTFRQIKSEIERLFNLQYQLDTDTARETRTITKTVQVGESLGSVVTSGYCNCSICCGQWSGGPTASGVYPTAAHTIAVDASNPTVPMGTEIIMNGTLYKVEDTGNFDQYGVDFDVYYDSHSAASAHGHKTWEAYYAGGSGESIEVSSTEQVTVSYITLNTGNLEDIVNGLMTEGEKEMYDIYQQTRGNRVFFGMPVDCNWYHNVVGNYGYRYSYSSGRVEESDQMTLSIPAGTEVLAVMDGTVKSVSGDTVVLKNKEKYEVKLIGVTNISVSAGDTVEVGQVIGKVADDSTLSMEFSFKGTKLNPYFYFETGTQELESVGTATGACAALIAEAVTHLGTPYVWGGYSPSGFDCSGFVSYCLTKSGARNTGHLTAAGLYSICSIISKSQLQPGDLVFFQGTYNTSPPSHVGIYIGSGVYGTNTFIHCGDPCKYGDLSSSYWVSHWYAAGRWY